jgi:hypothetical protein
MEVVEPDELFRCGHHVDTMLIQLEIYRLATMFLSTEQIADFLWKVSAQVRGW